MMVCYGTDLTVPAHCPQCGRTGRLGGFVCLPDSIITCPCGGRVKADRDAMLHAPPTLWQHFLNWLAQLRKVR